VKDYGQRTISDHTKALEAEKQVAMQVGVSLPTEVDAMTRAQYDELSRKTGRDFDTAYSDAMVSGHEAAVREFGGEATTGTNAAVKAYAQYELPMLRDHLRLARELSQQRRRPRPLPRARRTVRRPPRNCRSRR
jgi:putative membrane protein